MDQPVLTSHQEEAVAWLVRRLAHEGAPVVGLHGLAGTGKSFLIPFLADRLNDAGLSVTIGAPTHRAAMILRKKGLDEADTLHSHALMPYFFPVYACALDYLAPWITATWQVDENYFGEDATTSRYTKLKASRCPTHTPYDPAEYCNAEGVPLLIAAGLLKYSTRALDDLKEIAKRYREAGPRKALESLGIQGRGFFDGFGPRLGEGVLIIDEASMVGKTTLDLCQQAFPHLCLIGDPGQLPPVKEDPVFADIEHISLTEIHRQAQDSPIIQLAYAARAGTVRWNQLARTPGQLDEWMGVDAQDFLTAPLIVWRNKTRVNTTKAIRAALGYPATAVVVGEPLVCRASSQEDRALGFFNNALFRVREVVSENPLRVHLTQDDEDESDTDDAALPIRLHIEELHGEAVHPDAVQFRFGYAITAHTSQGGEWETVYIAKPDMVAHLGAYQRSGAMEEGNRWAYTAITRAKRTLGFMLNYDFTQSRSVFVAPQETAMPKMTAIPTEAHANGETPPDVLLDDIDDPVTPSTIVAQPPSVVDPGTPAGQMLMSVDEALYKFSTHAAVVLSSVEKSWDAALRVLNHNNQGVEVLAAALATYVPCVPYSAEIHVTSPSGYVMKLIVQNGTQEGFMGQMGTLMAFLQDNNFTPHIPAPF